MPAGRFVRLTAAVVVAVVVVAAAGPRPAVWASLAERTLMPISAHGVPELDITSSPLWVTFDQMLPILGTPNEIEVSDGCNWLFSPPSPGDKPPSVDAQGVLHVYGWMDGRVGCYPSGAAEWFLGFLASGPHVTIDGSNVIFSSNGATVTMTDAPGTFLAQVESSVNTLVATIRRHITGHR